MADTGRKLLVGGPMMCPKCFVFGDAGNDACPFCGHVFTPDEIASNAVENFMQLVDEYADKVASLGVAVGDVDTQTPRRAIEAALQSLISADKAAP